MSGRVVDATSGSSVIGYVGLLAVSALVVGHSVGCCFERHMLSSGASSQPSSHPHHRQTSSSWPLGQGVSATLMLSAGHPPNANPMFMCTWCFILRPLPLHTAGELPRTQMVRRLKELEPQTADEMLHCEDVEGCPPRLRLSELEEGDELVRLWVLGVRSCSVCLCVRAFGGRVCGYMRLW